MRSFFNCTNATQHIDPASHTQPSGGVQAQAAPGPMTRVNVENMLNEYVRDGLPSENRMEAKKRMLACFDELHRPLMARGLKAVRQALHLEQRPLVRLDLRDLQLQKLPESLSFLTGVGSVDFSHNQLENLPESIGDLSEIRDLTVKNNQLRGLPESIGNLFRLSVLNLGSNQLERLPDSIGKLSNLSSLILQHNQLQRLPDSIGELSSLSSLDLDDNSLRSLPDSIGDLSSLSLLYLVNNSLRSLPEFIGQLAQLEILDLKNNILDYEIEYSRSTRAIGFPEYCEQRTNRLETLPESIGNLQLLKGLNLHGNPLRELPPSLVRLPISCNVNLMQTMLPQTVREQLQNAIVVHHAQNPEQGPQIGFDMAQHNQAVQVSSLSNEIESWRHQASNYSAVETATPGTEQPQAFQAALDKLSNIEATALSGQLARMRVTAHFEKAPQDLVQRVNAFLDYVEQAPDVLKTCAAIAAEGTETCDDRIALAFIELEEVVVHHQSLSEPSMAKLLETARGLHKSQLLKDIAQKKVSTLVGFVDPTEIILKYVVNLSKEFNLPSQLDDMIFHHCARQVSNADIRHARKEIKKQATDANLNVFLATWHPWQLALSKQYPAEYAQVQTKVEKQQEKMHEKMDKLTDRLAATKTSHGERSTQYLDLQAQSNALKVDYRNIETNLLVQLTEQVRQQLV